MRKATLIVLWESSRGASRILISPPSSTYMTKQHKINSTRTRLHILDINKACLEYLINRQCSMTNYVVLMKVAISGRNVCATQRPLFHTILGHLRSESILDFVCIVINVFFHPPIDNARNSLKNSQMDLDHHTRVFAALSCLPGILRNWMYQWLPIILA